MLPLIDLISNEIKKISSSFSNTEKNMKSRDEIKILIVDDSRCFLELHGTYPKRICCSVFQAANSNDAINMAVKEKPAVIIMDLEMPGMRGDECCREIRSDPELKDIPIIIGHISLVKGGQGEMSLQGLRRCYYQARQQNAPLDWN